MKDPETDKLESSSEREKKKGRKPNKNKVSSKSKIHPITDIENREEMKDIISNILQNTVDKYAEIADNQLKTTRDDFEALQGIISEYLEDYLVIGHTLDGQRVVIRYTATPADLDSLTELSKKVLVRMMTQEQHGQ